VFAFDHPLAVKGLLRTTLLTGLVLLFTTIAFGQTFSNCVFSFWGNADQAVVSKGSTAAPTCDLLYKSSPPSSFSVLGSNQLPPTGSNELLPNGLFSFMNVYANAADEQLHRVDPVGRAASGRQVTFSGVPQSTVWVQKGYEQDGIAIIDDNANDSSQGPDSSLDIRVFNVPPTNLERYGIHLTLDPTSAQNQQGTLYGLAVGAHANNSIGAGFLATGSDTIGIQSIEGDAQGDQENLFIVGHQFNHFTNGHIFLVDHQVSTMTGDVLQADMANKSGAFLGNFLNFLNNGVQEFKVDSKGDVYVPSIKAKSGTRFVCVDTTGKLTSQTSPCSGT